MLFFKKKKSLLREFFTDSFVDIHSHLLPGIDDGAKDIDASIDLIKRLAAVGIKNFITTPHVLGDVYPNSSETIQKKIAQLQKRLVEKELYDIQVSAAAEYMLDEQFVERLQKNDILTLKDNYILVEMSYFNPPLNLFDVLFEIQLKGYKPILAHPERYNFYHSDFKQYYKLKNAGCFFQLNLLSLTKHYGDHVKRISHKLLEENLYDFVGTDTHHSKHIELLESIEIKKNKDNIIKLIENNYVFNKKGA